MQDRLTLAIAQAPSDLGSTSERMDWLEQLLPGVAQQGADIVLLPELFACGYAIGDALLDRAESKSGPTAQRLSRLAQEYRIAVHCGYAERDAGRLYNSAMCIGPEGTLIGHHRKLAIPPGFEKVHFTRGAGTTLFRYRGFKIATLICYDAEFPETLRHVAQLGAELVLVPTALGAQWGWVADTMMPTRAYENGVFLAYANGAGRQREMDFLGRSVIAAPDGEELARAGDDSCLIYAQLERARVSAAQKRLPYLADVQKLALE